MPAACSLAPASAGNRPYLRVHPLVAGTQQHGRAPPLQGEEISKGEPEIHPPQSSKEDRTAEEQSRTNLSPGRSPEGGTPSIRPAEVTDPGAKAAATPDRPGKKGPAQVPRALHHLPRNPHPGPDPVRNLRRESSGCPAEGQDLGPDSHLLTIAQTQAADSSSRPGTGANRDVLPIPGLQKLV